MMANENNAKETANKQKILGEILPASLVPSATGTGFLVIGSRKSAACFFGLKTYMLIAGSISLSIPIVAAVFRFICNRIYSDDRVDAFESVLLSIMKHMSKAIMAIETIILLVGVFVIGPNLPTWQHHVPNQSETYCDLGLMLFALTFLVGTWFFILAGGIIYLILCWTNRS